MTKRPLSSVTTIFAYLVGRSFVSAMIQTPASGPFSPTTCPPMSWAEILTLAARTAPPCSSANALTPVAINRFNFMSRSPMMRHSRNRPCLRRLWHTVGHGGYFDQSLLLVEGLGAEPFASHMVKTKAAWMERV